MKEKNSGKMTAPSFSVLHMDKSADPRTNFSESACGRWKKTHPLPKDKPSFGTFDDLWDWNLEQLRHIAELCESSAAEPYEKQVGKFYAAAMDTDRIEKARFTPIEKIVKKVDKIRSGEDVAMLLPELHLAGVSVFFAAFSDGDRKNSEIYSLYLYQDGLSLPDKDYYVKDSKEFADIRTKFIAHMERMMSLFGLEHEEARQSAKSVFDIEMEIAKASRDIADLRDPELNYNKMKISEFDKRFGILKMTEYMKRIGVQKFDYVVVGQPEFFDKINSMITGTDIEKIKAYLRWSVINRYASALHKEVDEEHFNFFRRTLAGQKEPEERWKRAVKAVDNYIGEALGKIYVQRHFGKDSKEKMDEMVSDIIGVFRERLKNMDWMAAETREKALFKLSKMNRKIGHPEKFRDYSSIKLSDDYAGNIMASIEFELNRQAKRVGKPVDRSEWGMTPPTVNAYYSQTENQIVFPAGILQPPFFDPKMDPAVNYGGIGAVISHEITHGFDDQGRRFDADGNLKSWWNSDDNEAFKKKAERIEKVFNSIEAMPGRFINGKLTLGENIADLGGISIAYDALNRKLKRDGGKDPMVDGLSQTQRFFIEWGQIWKCVFSNAEKIRLLTIDPHSPTEYRASVPSMASPAFDIAFPGEENDFIKKLRGMGIW
jgi:predicted metalloendopeptidase